MGADGGSTMPPPCLLEQRSNAAGLAPVVGVLDEQVLTKAGHRRYLVDEIAAAVELHSRPGSDADRQHG